MERLAGIPEEKMIEAHGSFHTGHCMKCRTEYPFEYLKGCILKQEVPKCSRKICGGVVKPGTYSVERFDFILIWILNLSESASLFLDIVFFGEPLPDEFYTGVKTVSLIERDFGINQGKLDKISTMLLNDIFIYFHFAKIYKLFVVLWIFILAYL